MNRKLTLSIIFSFFLALALAQEPNLSPIVFIYDASGSMWGQIDGKTKMDIASEVLSEAANNLPAAQGAGLVAYGHRQKGDCEDVEFLVDMESADRDRITRQLQDIKPLGKTPLAQSALQVIDRLREAQKSATIILVTDGIESCGGNICDVIKAAKAEGIDFRLHIIGFGLGDEETSTLECAAEAGNGRYFDANDADGLGDVLAEATQSTVDDPAENFFLYAVKNGEPIDASVKATPEGADRYTAGMRTYADTGSMYLAPGTYDLEIKPLRGSDVSLIMLTDVRIKAGQNHFETISFDGGNIQVNTTNNGEGWDATVNIVDAADGSPVARGRTYGRAQLYEVSPGTYTVKLKALKINGEAIEKSIGNVSVKAGGTTEVAHNFESGTVMIGATAPEGRIDAVINIVDQDADRSVAGGRTYTSPTSNPKQFVLNPGTYQVNIKALGTHQGKKDSFILEIKAGETIKKTSKF